jgi:hypothetical protein
MIDAARLREDILSQAPHVPDLSPERMQRIIAMVAETDMGARALAQVFGTDKNARDVTLVFDLQMTMAKGLCLFRGAKVTVVLNPRESDEMLAAVLYHEMRHVLQPRDLETRHLPNLPLAMFFSLRLREGDAFVQQIIFGIEHERQTGNSAVNAANLSFLSERMDDRSLIRFMDAAQDYIRTTDDGGKRAAMVKFFDIVQNGLMQKYDTDTLKLLEDFSAKRLQRDGPALWHQPAEQLENVFHAQVHRMQAVPDPFADSLRGHYLENTFEIVDVIKRSIPLDVAEKLSLLATAASDLLLQAQERVTPPAGPAAGRNAAIAACK